MSDTTAPYFKVSGTPAGPAPPGAGPTAGGGSRQGTIGRVGANMQRNKALWLAGAGAAVVGLALWQSRGEATEDEDDELTEWEIDTRDTDLYNELQPELEEVADRLDELEDERPPGTGTGPRPPRPGKPVRHFHRTANTDQDRDREGLWHTHPGGDRRHGHWWLQGPKGPKPKRPKGKPKPNRPRDRDDDRDGRGRKRRLRTRGTPKQRERRRLDTDRRGTRPTPSPRPDRRG